MPALWPLSSVPHRFLAIFSLTPLATALFTTAGPVVGLESASAAPLPHVVVGAKPNRQYEVYRNAQSLGWWSSDGAGVLLFMSPAPGSFEVTSPGNGDTEPPGQISDLAADMSPAGVVILRWTAPGGDGSSGTAFKYEIRWARSQMALVVDPTIAPDPPAPRPAGTTQYYAVRDLPSGATIHFAIRARDQAGNWGPFSNVAIMQTPADPRPARIVDFRVTATTSTSVRVDWTAPGDDGYSGQAVAYDFRWSLDGTLLLLLGGNNFPGFPAPAPGGTDEHFILENLPRDQAVYLVIRARDAAGNWGELSPLVAVNTDPRLGGRDAIAAVGVPTRAVLDRIQPNPVRTGTTIRFGIPATAGATAPARIDIVDVSGRLVETVVDGAFAPGFREISWQPGRSGARVPPGVYFAVLRAAGQEALRKITVVR